MNLLFLNYEYPPLGGGAGVCTKAQAEGLAGLGHKVTVVTCYFNGEKELDVFENLTIIRLHAKRKYLHKSGVFEMISWIIKCKTFLKSYCRKEKFDFCLCHFALPGGVVALMLKKRFNIPFVVISHGHDIPWFFPRQMFLYHLVLYPYIRCILNNAVQVVVLNKNLKDNAQRIVRNKPKVIVIPNGCRPIEFTKRENPNTLPLKILFCGRFVTQKDPFTFLKGILLFSKTGANFIVELIGDGPLRSKMELYVKKNNLNHLVRFRGWVNKAEMNKAYNEGHLLVMTSLTEAMSVVALEALSAGLFLISTDVGVNAEYIENDINGLIIPKNNAFLIAEKLKYFYYEKYMKDYTIPEETVLRVINKCQWGNIVEQYNFMLKNLS
ncbi:MAG: glycosyltransferase family 4 protein [Bacteroidales bacterium]|nr:glycosyltransferase family 4 protein [Bacteroidales bacterium]